MIRHIVLYQFDNIPQSAIASFMEKYRECEELANLKIEAGENISSKLELSGGFNFGLLMTFGNVEDIKKYNELKQHLDAKEIIQPYLKDTLVFDIDSAGESHIFGCSSDVAPL